MTVLAFVDTNVWFYALVDRRDGRHDRANALLDTLNLPVINGQVLRELGRVLLQKAACNEDVLRKVVADLYATCRVAADSQAVFHLASELRHSYRFSYWDSLIVASALDAGCETLFSEDMHHGLLVHGQLSLVNPFIHLDAPA